MYLLSDVLLGQLVSVTTSNLVLHDGEKQDGAGGGSCRSTASDHFTARSTTQGWLTDKGDSGMQRACEQ